MTLTVYILLTLLCTVCNKNRRVFFRYKFRLMFNKGTRNSEASISVFVKSGAPPSVLIRPLRVAKVNPTKSLVIESLIRSKKSINAVWTCVQSEGNLETKLISTSLHFFELFLFEMKKDRTICC